MGGPAQTRPTSQSRVLRRKLAGRLAVWTLAYALVLLVAASAFELAVSDGLADRIADVTSEWQIVPEEDADIFLESALPEEATDNFRVGRRTYQAIRQADGSLAVRDLSTYYAIRAMKWPLFAAVALLGYVGVVFVQLNRSLRYFDELSGAVEALVLDNNAPVQLSPDLAIAQGELNAIRETARENARAAVEAERKKNELVAYLAHDIRTPLTSVVGYLSLLNEAPDLPPDKRQHYVSTALAKAEDLDGLAGEFFEITRYNMTSIPIERTWVDLKLLLEQVAEEFVPALEAGALAIQVEACEGQRAYVDPAKLSRALGNVVRNAVANADVHSTIRIAAELGSAWCIRISNQGREIAPEHLESIFEKFFRTDASRTSGGGAGLGLAIARDIIQAHGGTIAAASEGGTTVFTITLPHASATHMQESFSHAV